MKKKNKYIITAVNFKLSRKPVCKINYSDVTEELKKFPTLNVASVRQAIINIRNRKLPDPAHLGNAGSFFKNPVVKMDVFNTMKLEYVDLPSYSIDDNHVKLPAAWLIQTCGWKGKCEGNVGTHESQPLVIVNYGGATGPEIYEFAKRIQRSVIEKFGIKLEMEVNII